MNWKRKDYLWISIITGFYLATGLLGVYDIGQLILWPIFALPMTLAFMKTRKKEIVAFVGATLSIYISVISTGGLDPVVISGFLLFILLPAFVFGRTYGEKLNIPKLILATTMLIFFNSIIFLAFSKLVGVDYLATYFSGLDALQKTWNDYLQQIQVQGLLPDINNAEKIYAQTMARTILHAKRTYPAALFVAALITSTLHLLLVQAIARIRSWDRPAMKEMLEAQLSSVPVLIFMGLWLVTGYIGGTDSNLLFAAESMMSILLTLFKVIGLISIIVMINKTGIKKVFQVLIIGIGVFWLIFDPILLVIIGCLDSIFNFRKIETLR